MNVREVISAKNEARIRREMEAAEAFQGSPAHLALIREIAERGTRAIAGSKSAPNRANTLPDFNRAGLPTSRSR